MRQLSISSDLCVANCCAYTLKSLVWVRETKLTSGLYWEKLVIEMFYKSDAGGPSCLRQQHSDMCRREAKSSPLLVTQHVMSVEHE